jgi:hypothetical protein
MSSLESTRSIESHSRVVTLRRRLAALASIVALSPAAAMGQRVATAHVQSPHFDVYAAAGTPGAQEIQTVSRSREQALSAVARLLDEPRPRGIRLTLFADEAAKKAATGHAGLGWAEGKTIEEVYNDHTRLDPYHELVHIVGASLGHPPAFLDEGLAVYISARLGGDALALLGHPGAGAKSVACELSKAGQTMPLERLFDLTEIGSRESDAPVAYPQSAAVVQFLVETRGLPRVRRAYQTLRASTDASVRAANRKAFRRIFDSSLADTEAAWGRWVCGGAV